VRFWNKFMWLRIGCGARLLWGHYRTFGYYKWQGVFCPAEWVSACYKWCYPKEVVNYYPYFCLYDRVFQIQKSQWVCQLSRLTCRHHRYLLCHHTRYPQGLLPRLLLRWDLLS
jgi:hypothetical protein